MSHDNSPCPIRCLAVGSGGLDMARRVWMVYAAIKRSVIVYGGYGEAVERVWRMTHFSGPLQARRGMFSCHGILGEELVGAFTMKCPEAPTGAGAGLWGVRFVEKHPTHLGGRAR
jgi:hypothetical protein